MKKMLFIAVPPLLLLVFAAAGDAMAQQQKKVDSSRASERVGNVRRRQIRKSNRRRVRRLSITHNSAQRWRHRFGCRSIGIGRAT